MENPPKLPSGCGCCFCNCEHCRGNQGTCPTCRAPNLPADFLFGGLSKNLKAQEAGRDASKLNHNVSTALELLRSSLKHHRGNRSIRPTESGALLSGELLWGSDLFENLSSPPTIL
ncbi:unnamed protein product [Schistocephalus solidus]|uniref:LAMA4 n=1 Tax=Schistocephalus solidus TaxID=70667 RepID=A0A183TBB1_SCHSO|nr:unnamed protein product [Schistocephalus solidus]